MKHMLILIVVSFVLVLLVAGYISYDLNTKEKTIESLLLNLKQHPKYMIYICLMMVCMLGISVVLPSVYAENSVIKNIKLLTLIAMLFAVAVIDYKRHIIPNKILFATLVLRIPYYIIELITESNDFWMILKSDLVACIIVIVFFIVGVLVVKNGIGMGDIKLMAVMCLYQGFYGVISSLFFSLFVAFFISIVLLIARKKTRKDAIAFAPAILSGTLLSVLMTGM